MKSNRVENHLLPIFSSHFLYINDDDDKESVVGCFKNGAFSEDKGSNSHASAVCLVTRTTSADRQVPSLATASRSAPFAKRNLAIVSPEGTPPRQAQCVWKDEERKKHPKSKSSDAVG